MRSEVAERYSEALYMLARENGSLHEKKAQAISLIKIFTETKELSAFFRAVKITKQEKKEMIIRIFSSQYDIDMIHFMELLVDKDRIDDIVDILKAFEERANEALGIQKAIVYSARELDENDTERIRNSIAKKTGYTIEIQNKVDPSLIAGIKVVTDNRVIDITMKNKIDSLKESLLKGGLA